MTQVKERPALRILLPFLPEKVVCSLAVLRVFVLDERFCVMDDGMDDRAGS